MSFTFLFKRVNYKVCKTFRIGSIILDTISVPAASIPVAVFLLPPPHYWALSVYVVKQIKLHKQSIQVSTDQICKQHNGSMHFADALNFSGVY
jgi:hypothetical protein